MGCAGAGRTPHTIITHNSASKAAPRTNRVVEKNRMRSTGECQLD
jgi:hypothetical protein